MSPTIAKYDFLYDSPVGLLRVCVAKESITRIVWLEQKTPEALKSSSSKLINAHLEKKITLALDKYFGSGLIDTEISLCPEGTLFQRKVWQVLKTIPLGYSALKYCSKYSFRTPKLRVFAIFCLD